MIEEVAAVSGPLKKYRVVRNGFETVMKLSDADAAKLGALEPYQVSDAVATIEPVTAVEEEGGGGGDDAADPNVAAEGAGVVADGAPGPEQVQSPQESEGDGQAPAPVTAPAPASVKKTAAKRASSSANKARTGAETKAADGGS